MSKDVVIQAPVLEFNNSLARHIKVDGMVVDLEGMSEQEQATLFQLIGIGYESDKENSNG